MYAWHNQWFPFDAHTPWMIHAILGWCFVPFVDVSWPMHAGHKRCHWMNTQKPRLMHTVLGLYHSLKGDIAYHRHTFQVRVCRPSRMLSIIGRYLYTNMCWQRMMLVENIWYLLTDVCRLWKILTDHVRRQQPIRVVSRQFYQDKFDYDRPMCACWG